MTPSSVPVVNARNEKVREILLSPEVFGVTVNEHLLYEAVKQFRAGGHRGTHMTKNRALVSGSGRKPWRQKGTGRARVGEIRNPLWRHGGTVFGPVPRDYSYAIPKKARAAALRSALAQRAQQGAIRIVESFPVEAPKTKVLRGILDQLGVTGKAVLVDHQPADALVLSGRNIPGLRVVDDAHLTVYDVLDCETLLVSQEALGKLEERLTP
ncbi:MAG: 50S ribosomal protein L4 [Acidobacteria bacterium]|nr:50S ribosomal protein L4 [Acidobacteriota bacterium]